MSKNNKNEGKKPTKKELVSVLKEEFDLEVKVKEITDEMYAKATKGFDRGLRVETMAQRLRFHLAGGAADEGKEKIIVEGVFVGSRDMVTKDIKLGKNKVQLISFLQRGDDGIFRLFKEPNTPSHFSGFDKSVFGKLVRCEMVITVKESGQFVQPKNIEILDPDFEFDTSQIEVMTPSQIADLEDYSPCIVTGAISSLWELRIPQWELDKWDTEDYPIVVKKNPVFQIYMSGDAEEGIPTIRANVNPTHLAKPFIDLPDFEAVWYPEDDLEEDIAPVFQNMEVIIIGQKNKNSEYEGQTYVDFVVDGVIAIDNDPIIADVKAKKKGKAAKKEKKKASEEEKNKLRREKVAESVTALKEETTVEIVREMHAAKFFKNVSDDDIQEMIEAEFEEQGIEPEEPEAGEEETEETFEDEPEEEQSEEEEDSDDDDDEEEIFD